MSLRSLLEGAGCGVLLTLRFARYMLPPGHEALLHPFPVSTVFLGVFIDLAAVSIVAALLLTRANGLERTSFLWAFVVPGVILVEIYDVSLLVSVVPSWRSLLELFGAVIFLCLGLWWLRPRWFKGTVRIVRGSLFLLGFSTLWMFPELLYGAGRSFTHEASSFHGESNIRLNATEPRIIWIIFDELSYDQAYEHRWTGLDLPNFDRLLGESVTFTNVRPAGFYTEDVIPSLFLGRAVSQIRVSTSGELSVYLDDVHQWRLFDASQTIFADARRSGWTSGLVGWRLPYCRIMAGWVDSCEWYNREPLVDNLSPTQSVLSNAAAPFFRWLYMLAPSIVPERYSYDANLARGTQRDYESLMKQAHRLLLASPIRFVFLHLNVPHPPGIYDRKAHRFARGGSYVDNLALADAALGQLLDTLESTPVWPQTTVIVCGDHSWRYPLWNGNRLWTAEDEAASGEHFDPRPVLSILFPQPRAGSRVSHEFPALALHDVIEGIIHGQIRSAADLAQHMGWGGAT
jgi:hypothetical protein